MKYWSAMQRNWGDLTRRICPDSEDMKIHYYDYLVVLSPFRQCLCPIDSQYGGGIFAVVGQLQIGKPGGGTPRTFFLCMEKDESKHIMSFFWVVGPGGQSHPAGGKLVGHEADVPNDCLNQLFPGLSDDNSAMPLRRWIAKYNM